MKFSSHVTNNTKTFTFGIFCEQKVICIMHSAIQGSLIKLHCSVLVYYVENVVGAKNTSLYSAPPLSWGVQEGTLGHWCS